MRRHRLHHLRRLGMPCSAPAGYAKIRRSDFKNRLFGFQYHFEFTEENIDAVVPPGGRTSPMFWAPTGRRKFVEETAKYYPRYARQGERILRNFVQFLKVY